jgi:nickel-dependent lactate racemase
MELPLGEGTVSVDLPDCEVDVARAPGADPVEPRGAAERGLGAPHGQRLASLADADDSVAIVVTDVTRATPDGVLVDCLLAELADAGVPRDRVTVVVGLGLHRPMTDAELGDMLGEHADLAVNHDPEDTVVAGHVDGTPVELNRRVAAADLVVSTGMVEPHQYAGFSGGAKTVAIGAGGEPLVRYTHGPEMLAQEGVRLGRIDDNPFRDAVDRAGDVAGLDFCLNVTYGPQGCLGAAAGEPRAVVRELADVARDALSVQVGEGYDAVVAGVGAPKDANLYQTTRAFTYVVLGAKNPLREGERSEPSERVSGEAASREGGRVVVPAALPEGAGEGAGEKRFYRHLSEADSAAALYESMREGYEPGAQRAFVVARALREHSLYITSSHAAEVVEACLMHHRDRVEDAIEPGSRVLVVPEALHTLLV